MMLAGLPVPDHAVESLAELVRAAGADGLAERLGGALDDDGAALLAPPSLGYERAVSGRYSSVWTLLRLCNC